MMTITSFPQNTQRQTSVRRMPLDPDVRSSSPVSHDSHSCSQGDVEFLQKSHGDQLRRGVSDPTLTLPSGKVAIDDGVPSGKVAIDDGVQLPQQRVSVGIEPKACQSPAYTYPLVSAVASEQTTGRVQRQDVSPLPVVQSKSEDVRLCPTSCESSQLMLAPCNGKGQQQELDRQFAEQLQAQLDAEPLIPDEYSTIQMSEPISSDEKAFDFVQRLIGSFDQMVQALLLEFPIQTVNSDHVVHPAIDLCLVNTDALVFQAERVFTMQEIFAADGKDVHVDIGFHYTHSSNMQSIKRSGLLSSQERRDNASPSTNANGMLFGDGIYTANNPFSYHEFGGSDQGLIVARLKGKIDLSETMDTRNLTSTADTVLGRAGSTDETHVLRSGSQCLALLQYNSGTISLSNDSAIGNQVICEAHRRMQRIVDETFNKGKPATELQSVRATKVAVRALLSPCQFMRNKALLYHSSLVEIVYYEAPGSALVEGHSLRPLRIDTESNPHPFVLRFSQSREEKCRGDSTPERWHPVLLCLAPLPPDTTVSQPAIVASASRKKPKFLFSCGRSIDISFARKGDKKDIFQWSEIFDNMPILARLRKYALDHRAKCKVCKRADRFRASSIQVGVMPTGSMRIDAFPQYKCSGFDSGTYVISYRFNEGTQAHYHPNQNLNYKPSHRVCFLPMNGEGKALLQRLKTAFMLGLTTKIGTSKTTGLDNSVVWSSIPHKTKPSPGKFGFPDAAYFELANYALDSLRVARPTLVSQTTCY